MKLGFVSAILSDLSLEEITVFASSAGYSCIEMCCWPVGKAERRYAGVTHIDVDSLDEKKAAGIKSFMAEKGVGISGLGYYPNPLDPDPVKSNFYVSHIRKVIDASAMLGVFKVNTFIGKDKNKTIEENFDGFRRIWPALIEYAESKKVKIGIENCPMYFTRDEWPGGNNLASSPSIWRRMFGEIKSNCFGLNYDPSHLVWQHMDYIKPIYEFREKLFHIHLKDAKILWDRIDEMGMTAYPNDIHSPKIPGMGDVDWGEFFSALNDIRYDGPVCVEVEDRAFEGSLENRQRALGISIRYLSQFI